MAEIKKLFKFGNLWGIGGFWAGTNSEYYIFSSRDTIIKEGKKISEYELKIEKKHPIFANIELKQDDINDTFAVDYEITFDPKKGKESLSGQIEENERHYKASESLTLKEFKRDKSSIRVCEKCQKEFKAMGAEDKCDNCKDNQERERERAELRNYENELRH